jgi:hypothetical protein
MSLKYTLDQARTRIVALEGKVGLPTPAWPLTYGNDCLGTITERLGLRTPKQLDAHFISIAAFRDWIADAPEAADWEEIPVSQVRPGDILFENWDQPRSRIAEHAEWVYSGTYSSGRLRITSANTGPAPGVESPRGIWRKYRDVGDWLVGAARPPYRNPAVAAPPKKRADARLLGTWMNQQHELRAAGVPETGVGDRVQPDGSIKPGDGVTDPAPRYWFGVQTWGHLHGKYPTPPFQIDKVPGDQSRRVEKIMLARAKAAKR